MTRPSPNTTTKVIHYLMVSVSHHPSVISRGFLIIHVKMKVLASFLLPQLKPVRGRRHCTSHWWWSLETARSTSSARLREGRAERLICGDAINQEQPWATGLTWKEGLDQYQGAESWLGQDPKRGHLQKPLLHGKPTMGRENRVHYWIMKEKDSESSEKASQIPVE